MELSCSRVSKKAFVSSTGVPYGRAGARESVLNLVPGHDGHGHIYGHDYGHFISNVIRSVAFQDLTSVNIGNGR